MKLKKQQGVVLVITLVMLLILTLLAVTSMQSTVLEEKMAGNYKDRNSAFESAEAALRQGEAVVADPDEYLGEGEAFFFDQQTTGLYETAKSGSPVWLTVKWGDSDEVRDYVGNLSNIVEQPEYIIEEIPSFTAYGESNQSGAEEEFQYYRITSRAVGNSSSALVMLQSTYKAKSQ